MKRVIYIISALACLFSCSGYVDYDDPNNVPEGILRVFADRTTLKADGTETVTFTVRFGSKDVSHDSNMNLVYSVEGNEITLKPGVNVFTTTAPAEMCRQGCRCCQMYSSMLHADVPTCCP